MKDKRCTAREAVDQIFDGASVVGSGFMWATVGHELMHALGERFKETGKPEGISYMQGAGQGNNSDLGVAEMTYKGLISKYVTGHFANNKAMIQMAVNDEIAAYNFPQGVIANMYRAAAGGKIGEITQVGLHTYCDPRLSGGKMNNACKEDLVELIEIHGEEYLLYKAPHFDFGFIRGTSADEFGNITMEDEFAQVDALEIAKAVKACGGKVFVQVKNYVSSKSIDVHDVRIPGTLVDQIIVCSDQFRFHKQATAEFYSPVIGGHYRQNDVGFGSLPFNERKVIVRRAAMEYVPGTVINLGIGIPEGVAAVLNEEGLGDDVVLTVESGLIGGLPLSGDYFGTAINAWAAVPMVSQFDFYDAGGLSGTFLGFAEANFAGDVNTSRFGDRIAGCGGFIDLTHKTKNITFCGTFTAGGLKTEIKDGKLEIVQEGKVLKFKKDVEQITFCAESSLQKKMNVKFVTERCVFEIRKEGLTLTEVAPGIDVEKNILPYMEFKPIIAEDLKTMDARLFKDEKMGLVNMLSHK